MKPRTQARALLRRANLEYLIYRPDAADTTPWEFPGAALEVREQPETALRRACRDLLGIEIEIQIGQPPFIHNFGTHSVVFRYYVCALRSGRLAATPPAECRWVQLQQLRDYVFDAPTQQVVDWLLAGPQP